MENTKERREKYFVSSISLNKKNLSNTYLRIQTENVFLIIVPLHFKYPNPL